MRKSREPHPSVGRPVALDAPWEKITLTVLEPHVSWLDMLTLMIRVRHHRPASRSELIRALIDAVHRRGIDLTRFKSREEIVSYLTAHFRRIRERHGLTPPPEIAFFCEKKANE